ncbi:MAG: patatin-like phospholipase family protein [Clostridia bacterium]
MKLALCLAGGGVKGAAHIGVLKAFEEENIEFEYISGASSGSIIATLKAIGYTSDEIYCLFKEYCKQIKYVNGSNIIKLLVGVIFRGKIIIDGLNSGEKIEKILNKICKEKNIENINQINKKLLIPSVDLHDGKIYFFTSFEKRQRYSDKITYVNDINIGKAVRASCTYPGVFSPCKYKDTFLVDGGIRENVPWKGVKENGADKVFCVTFETDIKEKKKVNIVDVIFDSLSILCHELSTYELFEVDYLLKIKTKKISLLDSNEVDYLYKEGYKQAKKFLKDLT